MAFADARSLIKPLTLQDAQLYVGSHRPTKGRIVSHSENAKGSLSGIITIQLKLPNGDTYRCAPLTDPLGLSQVNEEFSVTLELRGRTIHLEISSERYNRHGANKSSHTF